MKFENVCQTLNQYFKQNAIFRVLMPFAMIGMYVCAGLSLLGNFIYLGSLMNPLLYIGFWLFALLTLSNCDFKSAANGFGIYGIGYIYSVLYSLIKYKSLAYGALLYVALYGYFAFMAYRKSEAMK